MVSKLNDKQHTGWLQKIVTLAFALATITTVILFAWYIIMTSSNIPATETELLQITRERIQKINDYIENRENVLDSLITQQQIYETLSKKQNVFKNQSLKTFITSFSETHNFKNILLIDVTGAIIFSSVEGEKFTANLTQAPYVTTHLGRSFMQAMMSLTTSVSSLAFDYFLKTATLYMIKPVFHNKKLMGFVAAQIDPEAIYEISHNYFDLGSTGEVVLAELVKNGTRIVAPTRNDPEKLFDFIEQMDEKSPLQIQKAVLGQSGKDVGLDYRGIETVSAWGYIPPLAWGLAIKIDLAEVQQPIHKLLYLLYIALFITLLLGIILQKITNFLKKITQSVQGFWRLANISALAFVLFLASLFALGFTIYHYRNLQHKAVEHAHMIAQSKANSATLMISNELEQVALRAQAIAEDLSLGRLKKEDIIIRIERDLKENAILFGLTVAYAPYAYDAAKQLYAPRGIKKDLKTAAIEITFLESSLDYTSTNTDKNPTKEWYQTTMQQNKPLWFDTKKDVASSMLTVRYAVPFYAVADKNKTTPIGVVTADYSIDSIAAIAQKLVIGETGYAFLISKDGIFIYHPNSKLVEGNKTIFNLAQQQTNKELYDLGKKIIDEKSGKQKYTDVSTLETVWMHFNNIPIMQWFLGVVFSEKEIMPSPDDIRHTRIWILIFSIIIFLLLAFQLSKLLFKDRHFLQAFATAMGIIFLVGLIILIVIIYHTPVQIRQGKEAVITNETSLKAYLNEQQQKASSRYEEIITIPTGIILYSLSFPDTGHLSFTGHIWQKYSTKGKQVERGFIIPEAKSYGSTELSIVEKYRKVESDTETIGWEVSATLPQYRNYSKYPFDRHKVTIPIVPKDPNHAIILVPALADYRNIVGEKLIGLEPDTKISEFTIQKTFFSYITTMQPATYGIPAEESVISRTDLNFNLILIRGLLNAFIVYVIPILVILFSLFAVFYKMWGDAGTAIASYTGLLFALIVLHGNLRSNYSVSGFLYIEYLLFLAYITILLFIIHILLESKKPKMDFPTAMLRLFFWPVQIACWFIATVIVFYN